MKGGSILSESGQLIAYVRKGAKAIDTRIGNRSVSRTRARQLSSFDQLRLARGYESLSVREVTEHADVGRSTFSEHFEGKDDVLDQRVDGFLSVPAAATTAAAPSDSLRECMQHVGAPHAPARARLQSSARPVRIRALAQKLENYLETIATGSTVPPAAPLAFLAMAPAHAQLETVDERLVGDGSCDARTAALVLHAATRAGVSATFRSST